MCSEAVNLVETNEVVEKWIAKWKNDSLCFADIDEVWRSWIPKIEHPLEGRANCLGELFITKLETFLFYGYSSDWIEQMGKREEFTTCNKASTFNNYPYFFQCTMCEDPAVRRTLCVDCYMNSEHRTHNYTLYMAHVEHCCCGESGTWEKTWHCTKHSHDKEKPNVLPQDVESRARIVIETIVAYADDLLNGYKNIDQNDDGSDDECCLNFYTNSTFSPDKFREIVLSFLKIDCKTFLGYYQKFSQEGRLTFKLPKAVCETVKASVEENNFQIRARILRDDSVIDLEFVVSLLNFLQKCLTYGKEFRRIFSESMLSPFPSSNRCFAENFFISSSTLPSSIFSTIEELITFGMLKEYETKESLAKMIIARNDVIALEIDMNAKTTDLFFAIKTHLFTIPNLAHNIIANEKALSVIFIEKCKTLPERLLGEMYTLHLFRFYLAFVQDLLRTVPKIWSKELRVEFLNGLKCFLRVLSIFQGVDSAKRNTERRVEYQVNNWRQTFILSCLSSSTKLMLRWCDSDEEVFNEACQMILNMINENIGFENERSEKTVELLSYSTRCLSYDSKIHPVSIHLPLYRFLVGLLMLKLRRHDQSLLDPLKTTALSMIFHQVTKIHVMMAQYFAEMWNFNGDFAHARTAHYYTKNRIENFESDIQLVQIVACTTDPNTFLIKALEKYGLMDWVNLNWEDYFTTKEDDEMEQVICVSEQFLKFLIMVLTERYVPEVGCVTSQDCVKQSVIHCLCIKPSSRSEIKKFLNLTPEWDATADDVIEDVAVSKTVRAGETLIFELRREFCDRFNALHYRYDQRQISDAGAFQSQRRKAAGEPDCFPSPELPKLKDFFQPMVNIFQCDVMLHIMQTVLVRFLDSNSKWSSETQIQNVLYLIGHALQEEKSGYYPELSFTKKAAEWKLLDHLKEILRSDRDDLPKALLELTIKKYSEITNATNEKSLTAIPSEEDKKLRRSQLIAARRAQVMQNMVKMQNQFLEKNPVSDIEQTIGQPVDSNMNRNLENTCILCQVTEKIAFENENVLVMLGFVQYSTVLCDNRENLVPDYGSPLLSANLGPAFCTSSCGHVMHAKCLLNSRDPASRFGFDCPLCGTLSNAMLPLLSPPSAFKKHQRHISFELRRLSEQCMNQFQAYPNKDSLQVWKSLSYTVHVVETILKDSNKPILGHLSRNHRKCLECFVKIAEAANLFYSNSTPYRFSINWLRSFLALKKPKKMKFFKFDSLLRFDMFSLFVAAIFSEIAVIRENNCNYVLVFVAQIVQILIATNFDEMVDDVKIEDETPFKSILQVSGKNLNHLSEKFIWNYIEKACIPFLRCCVLFYSFLNDGPSPIELTELNGDTFSNMCSYLGFPQTREELFGKEDVYHRVKCWFEHPDVKDYLRKGGHEFGKSDPNNRINQLTELPHTYLELIKKAAVFRCVRGFNKQPKDHHMCLICGEMICTGICCQEYNAQVNYRRPMWWKTYHTFSHLKTCGSSLYLDVNTNKILLQSSFGPFRIGYVSGPYEDRYGNTDVSGTDSLFLSSEKYKELHTMMLNHQISETISRYKRTY